MAAYAHYQILKQELALENPKKIGACLTCKYWDVETRRTKAHVERVSLCVHPELKPFQLIVSGASACNRWAKEPGVPATATEYAEKYEQE